MTSFSPAYRFSAASRARATRAAPRQIAVYGLLTLGAVVSVAPFYYILRISFETQSGYQTGARTFSLESWAQALTGTPLLAEVAHSLIVTLASISLILAFSTLAGYAFARLLQGRAASVAFTVIVSVFMVPIQSIVVPLYLDSAHLGLINNYLGAIAVYAGLGLPFSTFMMTSFFRGIPWEITEAALLDGLGYVSVIWRVLLRMAVPALVTVFLMQFIVIWNDLLIALLWLPQPATRTITVGLATINSTSGSGGRGAAVPVMMAAAVVQALPAVALFTAAQRYVIRGLTLGADR